MRRCGARRSASISHGGAPAPARGRARSASRAPVRRARSVAVGLEAAADARDAVAGADLEHARGAPSTSILRGVSVTRRSGRPARVAGGRARSRRAARRSPWPRSGGRCRPAARGARRSQERRAAAHSALGGFGASVPARAGRRPARPCRRPQPPQPGQAEQHRQRGGAPHGTNGVARERVARRGRRASAARRRRRRRTARRGGDRRGRRSSASSGTCSRVWSVPGRRRVAAVVGGEHEQVALRVQALEPARPPPRRSPAARRGSPATSLRWP